ncbi:hypothetical protein J2X69_000016 [Algoriphagus sp. 4150]|uniref:hypothetical protein n=1 Tax=Algoriphagus sp. 4150 TaxID=2817756 RepID=UPI0028678FCD|nr:hypothetical protein [Algoriphagus sp. 4150]MDR7127688.1 hypothetical protein [Algoriphagus sp. 4150]
MVEFYRIDTLVNEASSFWVSLLVTVIGTLLGFLGAFLIYNRADRKEVYKENKAKEDRYKDRLKYLSQLVDDSLLMLSNQLDNFEELANDISQYPTEQHKLKIKASDNLKRLQNMDTEEVFHAYHLVIPESDEKIKNYKNIYNCIDFLYLRLEQAIDSADKTVNFTYRDQMFIKEKIDYLSSVIYLKINDLNKDPSKDPDFYSFLIHSHREYMKLVEGSSNIGNYEKDFLVPFGEDLRNRFLNHSFFNELIDLTSKALVRFNHMKVNASLFSSELKGLRKEMKDSYERLALINDEIKIHNK